MRSWASSACKERPHTHLYGTDQSVSRPRMDTKTHRVARTQGHRQIDQVEREDKISVQKVDPSRSGVLSSPDVPHFSIKCYTCLVKEQT